MNDTVNIIQNKIDNLYLIESVEEYDALPLNGTQNTVVLCVQSVPPFFTDKINDSRVSSWQQYGMNDYQISRYWMKNYKQIETVINDSIEEINEPMLFNKYLKMDYVAYLGGNYIEPIMEFDKFLTTYKPNVIYVSKNNGIANIIGMFKRRHAFVFKEIV